ncbi:hypothetical protein Tco_1066171 [Tanacetum coccineum]
MILMSTSSSSSHIEEVWKNVTEKVEQRNKDMNWKNVVNSIANGGCNNTIKSVLDGMAIATVVYFIWNEMNKRIFSQEQKDCQIAAEFERLFGYEGLRLFDSGHGLQIAQMALYLDTGNLSTKDHSV